jgi:hypothetical protein
VVELHAVLPKFLQAVGPFVCHIAIARPSLPVLMPGRLLLSMGSRRVLVVRFGKLPILKVGLFSCLRSARERLWKRDGEPMQNTLIGPPKLNAPIAKEDRTKQPPRSHFCTPAESIARPHTAIISGSAIVAENCLVAILESRGILCAARPSLRFHGLQQLGFTRVHYGELTSCRCFGSAIMLAWGGCRYFLHARERANWELLVSTTVGRPGDRLGSMDRFVARAALAPFHLYIINLFYNLLSRPY